MTEPRYPYQTNEDEIDLIELLQGLWEQKWLISAVTSLVLIFSVVYIFISKPVYSVTVVISPAPVSVFGLIAGEVGGERLKDISSVISIGNNLANDILAIVVKNIESSAVQENFNDEFIGEHDYKIYVEKFWLYRAKAEKDWLPFDNVSVSLSSNSAEQAKKYLDGYLAYVSSISSKQINEYFQALGVSHSITPESLYRVEQAPVLPTQPIKPKKPLVVALGLVLGGMLGVFIALIRLMLKKRSAKMAESTNNC